MTGWIKIHQSIKGHWIWERPLYLKWWLDLLMLAEWKDRKRPFGSSLTIIKRGQLAASNRFLRDRWQYKNEDNGAVKTPSPKTVIKFLSMLEQDGMITIDSSILPNKVTLITICNYDTYQAKTDVSDNTDGNTPYNTSNNTPNNTDGNKYEEYKEKEEEKEEENSPPTTHVRARREIEFCDELKNPGNQIFWEQSAMALHTDVGNLKKLLKDFTHEKIATQKWSESASDFRRHFYSWCRYALNRKNQEQPKQPNNNGGLSNNQFNLAREQRRQRGEEYARYLSDTINGCSDTGGSPMY